MTKKISKEANNIKTKVKKGERIILSGRQVRGK